MLQRLVIFGLPFVGVLGLFLVFDPFKVVRNYEAFGSHNPVQLNVDYVATETYLRHREERAYDAFIFGSSRTLAFRTWDWKGYIGGSAPLRYNANFESLFGVLGKIRLIERLGDRIDDALLLVDESLLEHTENSRRHIYIKHPAVSNEPWTSFYLSFFNAFVSNFFFVKYLDYEAFGTLRPYMEGAINTEVMEIVPWTNDLVLRDLDRELEEEPGGYYAERRELFAEGRSPSVREGEPVIGPQQLEMLCEIAASFDRQGTRLRVVVSPNFDRVPLAPQDLDVLERVFGAARVFDYSGSNDISEDERAWYEPGHFRPHVGRRILQEIYRGDEPPGPRAGASPCARQEPRSSMYHRRSPADPPPGGEARS